MLLEHPALEFLLAINFQNFAYEEGCDISYELTIDSEYYNQDFAIELSVLLLGTVEDKLRWIFRLYDLNKVNWIGHDRPSLQSNLINRSLILFIKIPTLN